MYYLRWHTCGAYGSTKFRTNTSFILRGSAGGVEEIGSRGVGGLLISQDCLTFLRVGGPWNYNKGTRSLFNLVRWGSSRDRGVHGTPLAKNSVKTPPIA